MPPLKPWWNHAGVWRVLRDLVLAELDRMRPKRLGVSRVLNGLSQPEADFDLDALDLDSLEMLDLATLVAARFQLDHDALGDQLLRHRRLDDWVSIVLDGRARQDDRLGFQTSGSTGRPKLCTHPMPFLEEEVRWFAERLQDRGRVLVAVPSHHIYGFLFGVMLPAALDAEVLDVRGELPGSVLRRARAGDLIVGQPFFYELATRNPTALADDLTALTSTERCPTPLWHRLQAQGIRRIVEIYGSSETVGIGVREAPDAPFQLLPQWSQDPAASEHIRRRGVQGDWVSVKPPDRLSWIDARHFEVEGREDGGVKIAGVKVFPQRVRRLLCEHPHVSAAMVRQSAPAEGGRLKAFVVPTPNCDDPEALPERLHSWLAERLPAVECPRAITIGNALPRSDLGKLRDWE